MQVKGRGSYIVGVARWVLGVAFVFVAGSSLADVDCCFVSTTGKNIAPYDSWENAATDLATVLALKPAEVIVGDGTFVNTVYEHSIDWAVNIHSLNGPTKTTLTQMTGGGRHFIVADNEATKSTVISGFTLDGGTGSIAKPIAWFDVAGGVISNCVISGTYRHIYSVCSKVRGHGRVVDCEFDLSAASFSVGSDNSCAVLALEGYGVADRCRIHDYRPGLLDSGSDSPRSAVRLDSASAVFRSSLVYNCALYRASGIANPGSFSGGGVYLKNGTVENCTIVNNKCIGNGGGIYAPTANGTIINCIVWGNEKGETLAGADIYAPKFANANVSYTCAGDIGNEAALPADGVGEGCTADNPKFVGDGADPYALSMGSFSCIDKGENTAASLVEGAVDLIGNPRLDEKRQLVDMGCYEYVQSAHTPLSVFVERTPTALVAGEISFVATPIGDNTSGLTFCWDFGDGTTETETLTPTHTYRAGTYTATLSLTNELGETTQSVFLDSATFVPAVIYVAKDSVPAEPYDTMENAASDLAVALSYAAANGVAEVAVGDGVFTNSVYEHSIDWSVNVHSLNGPTKTTLAQMPGGGRHFVVADNEATKATVISGFTLDGGTGSIAKPVAWFELAGGVISNCVIRGTYKHIYSVCSKVKGHGRVVDCEFDLSEASFNVGSDNSCAVLALEGSGVADRCRIHDYRPGLVDSGKDDPRSAVRLDSASAVFRNSLVYNCALYRASGTANPGSFNGGGVYLKNGTVENCTIVNNKCIGNGGGIYAPTANGTIINCIVWGNEKGEDLAGADIYAPKFANANVSYTCAGDIGNEAALPADGVGEGCTADDPKFVGTGDEPYALGISSTSCVDKGENTEASRVEGAVDLIGNPRLDEKHRIVDMGCYEYVQSAHTPLTIVVERSPKELYSGNFSFQALVFGDNTSGLSYCWDFGDGTTETGTLSPRHSYHAGTYTATLSMTNELGEVAQFRFLDNDTVVPRTVYVAKDGTCTEPYDSWEKATTNLAAALEVAFALGTPEVVVGDGVFTNTVYEYVIDRAIYLHSLNGPAKTRLVRMPGNAGGRHFTVADNEATKSTVIAGFALDSGRVVQSYAYFNVSGGVISNCVVCGTFPYLYSRCCTVGGHGRAVDCEFDLSEQGVFTVSTDGSCAAVELSGYGVVDRCVIHDYQATSFAGSGTFNKSAIFISDNAVLRNSLVCNCSVLRDGADHPENFSGGAVFLRGGTIANCTIVNNKCSGYGGGVYAKTGNGKIVNSIIWGNEQGLDHGKDVYAPKFDKANVSYTCLSDLDDAEALPTAGIGEGCRNADPKFRNPNANWRLLPSSPCIDKGDDTYYAHIESELDLRKCPRKQGAAVDLGCYEWTPVGLMLMIK